MQEYIVTCLQEGIELRTSTLNNKEQLTTINNIGELFYATIIGGGKILFCGNGGSAADAQHIVAELVCRVETERRGLPAIALTTDTSILTAVSNDYGYERVFSRQVAALATEKDVVVGITTSGKSKNIELALKEAQKIGATTVGLLGGSGGTCKELCNYSIVIDNYKAARVQEMHITIGHIICGIVDKKITTI